MTRHGKNCTASSVYSYAERRKDAKASGYGTLRARLGADSVKEFDCCSLTLQPCRDPVVTPNGYIFDKEAVIEYMVQQKKENARKLKEWEKQNKLEQEKAAVKSEEANEEKKRKFTEQEGCLPSANNATERKRKMPREEGTYVAGAGPSSSKDSFQSVSNMAGENKNKNGSFWVPALATTAEASKLEKPQQKVLCPVSGRVLKLKEFMPVKFTPVDKNDDGKRVFHKKDRYMCPVTHDILTNTTPCAYLKTSQVVVTMECVEKIIKKDMIDPISGAKLEESDIIELQRGGTGFSATNKVEAKLVRPQLELT
ncbi:hypothetical protein QR680_015380 [Steinernema hermaphroditum]|uniref:Nitric oxide synthase-interacting protein homolog n=1 Tax=Steinernema hermaphroditum TaxID=289476 RepID=A0AA39LK46_9BILA|nr:hypothetical protein QR680_015380 [Steinernema hermaphroditum]